MSCSRLVFVCSLVAVVLVGCGPDMDTHVETSSTQAATAAGQSVTAATRSAIDIPQFQYPEQFNLQSTRELRLFNASGLAERFEESFHSDGAGQISLMVNSHAATGMSSWSPPSTELVASYFSRQSYLVKYRDLHLGSRLSLQRNFRWTEQPGVVQVAGIDCRRINAHSVEGLGDFDFLVAADSTDLLLGWTTYDVQGNPVMQMETTSVDFTPDHSGIAWATPLVAEQPYTDLIDEPLLGFTPITPQYLPPGFYMLEKRLLLANGILTGLGNIHAALYSDGIHLLFVAQQQLVSNPTLTFLSGASLVKFASIGGIGVAEGDLPGKRIYVVSQLPTEELQTVFGSMF